MSYFKGAFLVILFIFSLNYFQATPWQASYFNMQAFFIVGMALFTVIYSVDRVMYKHQLEKVPLYYAVLILLVPFYGALMADIAFGQPLIYGLLSERSWYLLGAGILLYHLLMTRIISFELLENVMVMMIWASFFYFLTIIVTDSFGLIEYDPSNMIKMTGSRGVRYKFEYFFITFGTIYYFAKFMLLGKYHSLLVVWVFIVYILFCLQGRTYMLSIAMTLLILMFFNGSFKKIALFVLSLLLGTLLIMLLMPDYVARMTDLFVQMFTVLGGDLSNDSSSNARLREVAVVLEFFETNPETVLFGSGSVSGRWEDGYNALFDYFYPSDIGLLGGLFIYGVVGMVFIHIIPFLISLRFLWLCTPERKVFVLAIKYTLVFAVIKSLQGIYYFKPMIYALPLFILLALVTQRKRTMQGEARA